MIKKIKSLVNTEEKKRLLSNFFSLLILQGANYILPLITFPYLVRVLGVEKFGLLAFATATIAYFNILTDYGFNLTATREVSIYRNDKEKLNEIFSSVMTIKFFLMFISFILLLILIFSFERFRTHYEIFLLTFGVVIGQVLFPQWFFQGIERMKYITYLNILAKIIFTISIFIFVHKTSDYWKVPLINSLGFIFAGILALWIMFKNFKIKFKIQNFDILKFYLIDGWHLFISGILTVFYTVSATFILGIFTNNTIVGYYSIAEKIVKVVTNLYSPIIDAIYPYITNKLKKSKKQGIQILTKITIYSIIIMGIVSFVLFIFSPYLIFLVSGQYLEKSILVLKIFSFYPVLITLAKIFAFNYIISMGYQKYLPKIYFYSSILSICLFICLIPIFKEVGIAISIMIIEIFATFKMYKLIKNVILNKIEKELI